MNIVESFSTYIEGLSGATLGTNLFIGGVPLSAPSSCYWIIGTGGSINLDLKTGEKIKTYTIQIYYRNTDAEAVYDNLQSLEELINSDNCTTLSGYDTIDMTAVSFPVDRDIDDEDRTVGLLETNITIYKE